MSQYKHPIGSINHSEITCEVHKYEGGYVAWVWLPRVVRYRRVRRFSIKKYGEKGAKLLAAMKRLEWLVEYGIFKPDEGDPLQFLSFDDTVPTGSVITERHSPFIREANSTTSP